MAVVGAGSSGAALAARLSERSDRRVVLLDSGPDRSPVAEPAARDPDQLPGDHDDRVICTHVEVGRPSGPAPFLRGRLVGGSSAVNGAYFVRPTDADLDRWAAAGHDRWSAASLLPAFRRLERDLDLGTTSLHGSDGPVTVQRHAAPMHPLTAAFFGACDAEGHREHADLNDGGDRVGPGAAQRRPPRACRHRHRLSGPGPGPAEPGDPRWLDRVRSGGRARPRGRCAAAWPRRSVGGGACRSGRALRRRAGHAVAGRGNRRRRDVRMLRRGAPVGRPALRADRRCRAGRGTVGAGRAARGARLGRSGRGAGDVPAVRARHRHRSAGPHRVTAGLADAGPQPCAPGGGTSTRTICWRLVGAGPAGPLVPTGPGRPARRGPLGVRSGGLGAAAGPGRTWHGPSGSTLSVDERLDEWIAERVAVSMHAAGSAPMGPAGDGAAVVDQIGSVHAAPGLRIVDTSILPGLPSRGPACLAITIAGSWPPPSTDQRYAGAGRSAP